MLDYERIEIGLERVCAVKRDTIEEADKLDWKEFGTEVEVSLNTRSTFDRIAAVTLLKLSKAAKRFLATEKDVDRWKAVTNPVFDVKRVGQKIVLQIYFYLTTHDRITGDKNCLLSKHASSLQHINH